MAEFDYYTKYFNDFVRDRHKTAQIEYELFTSVGYGLKRVIDAFVVDDGVKYLYSYHPYVEETHLYSCTNLFKMYYDAIDCKAKFYLVTGRFDRNDYKLYKYKPKNGKIIEVKL